MAHTPFRKYVWTHIVAGLDFTEITRTLGLSDFVLTEDNIKDEYETLKQSLPPALKDLLEKRGEFMIDNEHVNHIQWLRAIGILDYYRFKKIPPSRRPANNKSFEAFEIMEMIMKHRDIMIMVNRFLFNGEEASKIATLVSHNLGRIIPDKAIEVYRDYLWDIGHVNAKNCFVYYKAFRTSAVITREGKAVDMKDEMSANVTDALLDNDDYFKWKAGMQVNIGNINDRLREVATDCYFKLKEAIYTTQVIDRTISSGTSFEGEPFDNATTNYQNVQKETTKVAKVYLDMFLKANGSIVKEDKGAADSFFERLGQVAIEFPEEKIESYHKVFDDVKEDIH